MARTMQVSRQSGAKTPRKHLATYSSLTARLAQQKSEPAVQKKRKRLRSAIDVDSRLYYSDDIDILLRHFCHNDVYIFEPLPIRTERSATLLENIQSYQNKRAEHIANGEPVEKKAIIPINIDQRHWVLAYVKYAPSSMEVLQVGYFDSLDFPVKNEIKNALLEFKQTAFDNFSQKIQKNSYDCGPWIVEMARLLVSESEIEQIKNVDITEARKKHDKIIQNHKEKQFQSPREFSTLGELLQKVRNDETMELDLSNVKTPFYYDMPMEKFEIGPASNIAVLNTTVAYADGFLVGEPSGKIKYYEYDFSENTFICQKTFAKHEKKVIELIPLDDVFFVSVSQDGNLFLHEFGSTIKIDAKDSIPEGISHAALLSDERLLVIGKNREKKRNQLDVQETNYGRKGYVFDISDHDNWGTILFHDPNDPNSNRVSVKTNAIAVHPTKPCFITGDNQNGYLNYYYVEDNGIIFKKVIEFSTRSFPLNTIINSIIMLPDDRVVVGGRTSEKDGKELLVSFALEEGTYRKESTEETQFYDGYQRELSDYEETFCVSNPLGSSMLKKISLLPDGQVVMGGTSTNLYLWDSWLSFVGVFRAVREEQEQEMMAEKLSTENQFIKHILVLKNGKLLALNNSGTIYSYSPQFNNILTPAIKFLLKALLKRNSLNFKTLKLRHINTAYELTDSRDSSVIRQSFEPLFNILLDLIRQHTGLETIDLSDNPHFPLDLLERLKKEAHLKNKEVITSDSIYDLSNLFTTEEDSSSSEMEVDDSQVTTEGFEETGSPEVELEIVHDDVDDDVIEQETHDEHEVEQERHQKQLPTNFELLQDYINAEDLEAVQSIIEANPEKELAVFSFITIEHLLGEKIKAHIESKGGILTIEKLKSYIDAVMSWNYSTDKITYLSHFSKSLDTLLKLWQKNQLANKAVEQYILDEAMKVLVARYRQPEPDESVKRAVSAITRRRNLRYFNLIKAGVQNVTTSKSMTIFIDFLIDYVWLSQSHWYDNDIGRELIETIMPDMVLPERLRNKLNEELVTISQTPAETVFYNCRKKISNHIKFMNRDFYVTQREAFKSKVITCFNRLVNLLLGQASFDNIQILFKELGLPQDLIGDVNELARLQQEINVHIIDYLAGNLDELSKEYASDMNELMKGLVKKLLAVQTFRSNKPSLNRLFDYLQQCINNDENFLALTVEKLSPEDCFKDILEQERMPTGKRDKSEILKKALTPFYETITQIKAASTIENIIENQVEKRIREEKAPLEQNLRQLNAKFEAQSQAHADLARRYERLEEILIAMQSRQALQGFEEQNRIEEVATDPSKASLESNMQLTPYQKQVDKSPFFAVRNRKDPNPKRLRMEEEGQHRSQQSSVKLEKR